MRCLSRLLAAERSRRYPDTLSLSSKTNILSLILDLVNLFTFVELLLGVKKHFEAKHPIKLGWAPSSYPLVGPPELFVRDSRTSYGVRKVGFGVFTKVHS